MSATISQLASQWANPSEVTTVLMVIGGDVVQKALAQTTGCWYTPVCFSFGWVAYTFMALVNLIGSGRLLPPPDYPVKMFNLGSGYSRENRNWLIGRLVRDNEAYIAREEPMLRNAIRISVWKAKPNPNRHTNHSYGRIHMWGLIIMVFQLVIAAIPVMLHREWGILLVTSTGTILAMVVGALPQWRVEKLPNRQNSKAVFALTSGNGSKDIMIVIGNGQCLDLEELSAQETPRNGKPWEKFAQRDSEAVESGSQKVSVLPTTQRHPRGSFYFHRAGTQMMMAKTARGLPSGFWITLCVCVVQSILWLVLIVTVSALHKDTWFLILVGGVGMFQNGYLAAMERSPQHRNLPLELVETITRCKVMDGLMDLEVGYGFALPLRNEFFPGQLREDEVAWWKGDRKKYDEVRSQQKSFRGAPRSEMTGFESPRSPACLSLPGFVKNEATRATNNYSKHAPDLSGQYAGDNAIKPHVPKPL
ncbi:uncharacterized protein BCR38DRAFT_432753 [Pseudomassariella vexata]|uniref:Uncharacterized protein n=1 Tax=Pseudomassariella vexata TaxID=1141098 RepID=A0A1Y2E1M0_9PEZI|nr:uncharacterized protein BCR38DRAFT_432753 [Pseudomassariella vexata]ORY65430.1 hypothetical protein BCR38DRAFT_432753 [Pseudomassariella vexata]